MDYFLQNLDIFSLEFNKEAPSLMMKLYPKKPTISKSKMHLIFLTYWNIIA